MSTDETVASRSYPCGGCGASVAFAPGTAALRCPYCGHEQEIVPVVRQIVEHSYAALAGKSTGRIGSHILVCPQCHAEAETDAISERCPFCGAARISDEAAVDQIAPEAVVPIKLDPAEVRHAVGQWVATRRFAPSQLRRVTETETLVGTYLPHWTFDARTESDYTGERGTHYWVTETYTTTVNGRSQVQTRQVRRTRWRDARGTVRRDFNDILVPATTRLEAETLEKVGEWPLHQAVAYQPEFLAGFQALRYDVGPEAGLTRAKAWMAPQIESDCESDIGGDEQRVDSVDTRYSDVTYKLMLLPVWIACYLHAGRSYQVVVNGSTGQIVGDRPYSVVKIALAVAAAIAVLAAVIALIAHSR